MASNSEPPRVAQDLSFSGALEVWCLRIHASQPRWAAITCPAVIVAPLECSAMWSGRALSNTALLPLAG
jgi:hypothetical protein